MKKTYMKTIIIISVIIASLLGLTACSNYNIENCMPSVLEVSICDSEGDLITQGTGFCVKNESTIMSVSHLFDNYNPDVDLIKGSSIDGNDFVLRLIIADQDKDIALLELVDKKMQPLKIADKKPKNLDEIFTIGNSRGYGLAYNNGIVSMSQKSLAVKEKIKTVMQTNLTINPGDSGAPVINKKNQIVGMMSFKLTDGKGQSVDGISFSVLLDDLIAIL